MRAAEFLNGFRVFTTKIKIKQPTYSTQVDVTVFAKNAEMARRILKNQYGKDALINNVREINHA